MKSGDITVTDATLKNLLVSNVEESIRPKISKQIQKTFEESKTKTGRVLKMYPYLSKAEVKLDDSGEKVICRLPHHYMGDILDLYVPSGDSGYCERLHEPCIYPRGSLSCLVLQIKDSKEYFLVNYYLPDDLVGVKPPEDGNVKLVCITGTNENYIEFGYNGLNIVSHKRVNQQVGSFEDDLEKISYPDTDTVYSKDETYSRDEVYTKEEVDELIRNAINEALGD